MMEIEPCLEAGDIVVIIINGQPISYGPEMLVSFPFFLVSTLMENTTMGVGCNPIWIMSVCGDWTFSQHIASR